MMEQPAARSRHSDPDDIARIDPMLPLIHVL